MTDVEQPRYLRYERFVAVVAGLNHQASNLACLLREAHASGRRAILPPLQQAAGVGDGAVLFVLSDERDPAFWNRLRQHYRVFARSTFRRCCRRPASRCRTTIWSIKRPWK